VNSKSPSAHTILNAVNSLCFVVHLRIHPQNLQKYIDKLVWKPSVYEDKAFGEFMHVIDTSIFSSGIIFRRRTFQIGSNAIVYPFLLNILERTSITIGSFSTMTITP
jgi:hypothetical protein